MSTITSRKCTLAELNALSPEEFVRQVGGVFEHSPWIAAAVAGRRPFADLAALHAAMCKVVSKSDATRQLALIQAHPDLAGRLATQGLLTEESSREQAAAGLAQGDATSLAEITTLNAAYRARFGFPFVICARLNNVATIIAAMHTRLTHSPEEEMAAARDEIFKIALLRLSDMVEPKNRHMSGQLTTHVLDTAAGRPAAGIPITLHRIHPDGTRSDAPLATTSTNSNGRTETPLLAGAAFQAGWYELTFSVGAYFQTGFLDSIPIRFRIEDPSAHYHVPLLCSPWSYSTYRGS